LFTLGSSFEFFEFYLFNFNFKLMQPDLVKVSSPAAAAEQTLQRENSQLRERLGHSAKGFTAMAVALSHVTKEVND
jgi:hypothetical protein